MYENDAQDQNERNPMKGYRDDKMRNRECVSCVEEADRDMGLVKCKEEKCLV